MLKIIMLVTVFIAIFISIIAAIITFLKHKKIIKSVQEKNKQILKARSSAPIIIDYKYVNIAKNDEWVVEDLSFLLDTIHFNKYKNILISGNNDGFEGLVFSNQLKINVFIDEKKLDKKIYKGFLYEKEFTHPAKLIKKYNELEEIDFAIFKNISINDIKSILNFFKNKMTEKSMLVLINPKKTSVKQIIEEIKKQNLYLEWNDSIKNKKLLISK